MLEKATGVGYADRRGGGMVELGYCMNARALPRHPLPLYVRDVLE